jgi:hypothetical protein
VWEMAAGKCPPLDGQRSPEEWPPLSSPPARMLGFSKFIQMCFDPAVIDLLLRCAFWDCIRGIRALIMSFAYVLKSQVIRDRCERRILAQLVVQCTAFDGAEHSSPRG